MVTEEYVVNNVAKDVMNILGEIMEDVAEVALKVVAKISDAAS